MGLRAQQLYLKIQRLPEALLGQRCSAFLFESAESSSGSRSVTVFVSPMRPFVVRIAVIRAGDCLGRCNSCPLSSPSFRGRRGLMSASINSEVESGMDNLRIERSKMANGNVYEVVDGQKLLPGGPYNCRSVAEKRLLTERIKKQQVQAAEVRGFMPLVPFI